MDSSLSASDIALMNRDGDWGGNSFLWIFALLILANGGFGGWGNRTGEFGQFATAASQSEILLGQKFDALSRQINQVGDGLCSSTYALNNSIHNAQDVVSGAVVSEGRAMQTQLADCCCTTQRNIDSVRFDMSNYASAIQANDTANTQKILDAICQNKIETMQNQINQLQLQNAVAGVVRYPNQMAYNAGTSPFCNNGCGCGNI